MIIDGSAGVANLAAARIAYEALFRETLGQVTPTWPVWCMETRITGSSAQYNWMDDPQLPEEFTGTATWKQMRSEGVVIADHIWRNSFVVTRQEYEDDQLAIINSRVMGLAEGFPKHQDYRATQSLIAGFSTAGYDGVNFFAATHPREGGLANQSNTAAGALTATTFNTAMAAMMGWTDRYGTPMGIVPTHLMFGPKLRDVALSILGMQYVSDGTTTVENVNRNSVLPIMNPFLVDTSDDYWFLLACGSRGVKPGMVQKRLDPEFNAMDSPTDSATAEREEYRYYGRARYGTGLTMWQLAYGANVA